MKIRSLIKKLRRYGLDTEVLFRFTDEWGEEPYLLLHSIKMETDPEDPEKEVIFNLTYE